MLIKILGTWCPKCKLLYKTVDDAAKKLEREYEIVKIDDMEEIAQYNIMTLPALIIDDMLVLVWWSPEPHEMLEILQEVAAHDGHQCCGGGECSDCADNSKCHGWCDCK